MLLVCKFPTNGLIVAVWTFPQCFDVTGKTIRPLNNLLQWFPKSPLWIWSYLEWFGRGVFEQQPVVVVVVEVVVVVVVVQYWN